jgi:hypothetical protein
LGSTRNTTDALETTAYVLDWKSTRDMTKRYNKGFQEQGLLVRVLFGSNPSPTKIDVYFTVLIPSVLFAAHSGLEHQKLILTTAG